MSGNANRYAPSRANLKEVAKLAGVSAMTASRALNNPDKVADETRKKVQDAAEALHYLPNLAANTLRRERSGIIVAIVPTIDHSFFSDTVDGISHVLEDAGSQLLLGRSFYSAEKEERLIRTLLGYRPDGVILTGTMHTVETHRLLKGAGIPVVEIWDIVPAHVDMAVGFDNFAAGYEIARYAIDCGYRSFGYVATNPEYEARENRAAQRSAGVYAAIAEAAIDEPLRKNLSYPIDIHEGGKIAAEFVAENRGIDAIICSNEIFGVGTMIELQKRGWSIPDDIAVCGIGDASIAALVSPGLTTIQFRGREMGLRSAALLLDCLDGKADVERFQDVGFEIIARGSTKNRL
jgi:LacI family gluconate utilization system Gnt-I transcriptional repressor